MHATVPSSVLRAGVVVGILFEIYFSFISGCSGV